MSCGLIFFQRLIPDNNDVLEDVLKTICNYLDFLDMKTVSFKTQMYAHHHCPMKQNVDREDNGAVVDCDTTEFAPYFNVLECKHAVKCVGSVLTDLIGICQPDWCNLTGHNTLINILSSRAASSQQKCGNNSPLCR